MNLAREQIEQQADNTSVGITGDDRARGGLRGIAEQNRQLRLKGTIAPDGNSISGDLLLELEKARAELQEKALYLQTLFETVPVGIFVVDAETRLVLDLNPHAQKVMGSEKDQIVGFRCNCVICPAGDDACPILDLGQSVDQSERVVLTPDGRRLPVLKSVVSVVRDGHEVLVESFVDITKIKQAELEIRKTNAELSTAQERLIAAKEEAETAALRDSLTKLPNRRLLAERLSRAMATSRRSDRKSALLFIDLDDFKTLNDTLGHPTGDLLLQEIARRLTSCVRDTDTVARLGGDEFVVVLEELSDCAENAASQAELVAAKIQASICQTYQLKGREWASTSSIGIALFGDPGESADDVLQQADIAMYQAKAAGRHTIRFFAPALQVAINARAAMEEALRNAIKTNQFVLHYQPQVHDGDLIGVEALIRWNHPARGILAPGQFIPLAEETGMIHSLGEWVLETACKQISVWAQKKETAHLTTAVNISVRQFRQADFVERVLDVLHRTGANPLNLKLEITESVLADSLDEVIAKMTVLRTHGLGFSLDDFGTGYSSLSYLKHLPLDQLKIDRAFIRDMLADHASMAIAQSIISLGRAMGLSVIAEGVETAEELGVLESIGCHMHQGYFFSKPLPVGDLENWMAAFARDAELTCQCNP